MDDPRPVILFDGDCNFCNTTVRRILLPASSKRRKTWVLMTSDRETDARRLRRILLPASSTVTSAGNRSARSRIRYARLPRLFVPADWWSQGESNP